MSIQAIIPISVDFYNKKYILVNAKQLDRGSRFLSVTCYINGELFKLNDRDHASGIRYKKADDHSVFNWCAIDSGKIIVELTEQMLAAEGVCVADLVIVNRDQAKTDETGAFTNLDEATILSTMPIYIDVTETAVNNSEIESSYEYNAFNQNLANYWKRFEDAIKSSSSWADTAESWAVGGTGTRNGENTNNSKYWSTQSQGSADASATSASNANTYMNNALGHSNNAYTYMTNAENYKNNASQSATASANSATAALNSQNAAKSSEDKAKSSENKAKESETKAAQSESNALTYMNNANTSKANAATSETNALNSANRAQSYAVGGTGTRTGEDTDNVSYYYNLVKTVVESLNGNFVPMGTIEFAQLATAEKATGYSYNIKDDFVTDDTFAEGAGVFYTAGVNVYCRADGFWDAFGGGATPIASVDEVKEYLGINEENEENEEGTEIV